MKPPTCKNCGKAEWHHTCVTRSEPLPGVVFQRLNQVVPVGLFETKLKTDRKEYLKLKARERRARQKAEKAP